MQGSGFKSLQVQGRVYRVYVLGFGDSENDCNKGLSCAFFGAFGFGGVVWSCSNSTNLIQQTDCHEQRPTFTGLGTCKPTVVFWEGFEFCI